MATYTAKKGKIERAWWVLDLDGQVLGRAATRIANVLLGKHKATFSPHVDVGDFVVVVNADKVRLTGRKLDDKVYHWHTGFVGGIRSISARHLRERAPARMIQLAVKRMLGNTPLRRAQLRKLKVYAGAEHPHAAQKPQKLAVKAAKA
ncbi:MAG TPA: 50S ribosomal protein L13 [Myxococcota bacterium]|jgi:large subunit ribosomal protein L13|nr:50S ribosomal protein L13 [Myxococcota bacterium]